MALRGEIEVTLPNRSLIRVVKITEASYADMIQIVQIGLNGSTDTAGVIGSIAHHMDAIPHSENPVHGDIRIYAAVGIEDNIIVKYRVHGPWLVTTLRRDVFLRMRPPHRMWTHIRCLGVPLETLDNPETNECD